MTNHALTFPINIRLITRWICVSLCLLCIMIMISLSHHKNVLLITGYCIICNRLRNQDKIQPMKINFSQHCLSPVSLTAT